MSFLSSRIEKVMGKEVELLEAARTGNLQTVEKILSSGKGRKSHHVGAALVKLSSFLKSVNVNYTDKNGYSALHHAAVNGYRDVVEALLKADAQPGLIDCQGCTPVHLAAWNGDAEIVMQLLTAGIDSEEVNPVNVNHQNGTGDTALHCAAQYGHVAVVDVLLQKSANPTIRNLNEASPLDLASQYGRLEVVQRLLISHPELARHPSSTQSPLHLASRNGHRDIVAVLLDNNFDIQTMTETGNALHEAALHGKLDVVKLLLQRSIDVNQRDNKGQTVLELLSAHQAQQKSFTEITKAIQEHMNQSGDMYESLANCRSGTDKPTAAVKPLPPEKPSPSDRPHPPDKPLPVDAAEKEGTPERPVPTPRVSMYKVSPEGEQENISVVPTYSKPNKEKLDMDRVISTASSTTDDVPPPLPPRHSIFTQEGRLSSLPPEHSIPSIPESSPPSSKANMPKPKKPPRQKRSPAPVRKSPPLSSQEPVSSTTSTPEKSGTNIPESFVNIPPAQTSNIDSTDCESTSQHSMQNVDQLHSTAQGIDQSDCSSPNSCLQRTDQSDCSNPNSTHCCPPVKSPRPSLSPKTIVAKEDNSVDPKTTRPVSEGFYMEMSKVNHSDQSGRPVSEVKPQVKASVNSSKPQEQQSSQQGVDNYGILFPNLRKLSADLSRKTRPELRRMNTAPNPSDDVYVSPNPSSPTDRFKEKHGQLRRANTAPEESTYLVMSNKTDGEDSKGITENENEYSEIPEKEGSLSQSSPKENIYATITENDAVEKSTATLEVDTNVYSQIKDLSPVPSPKQRSEESKDDCTENKDKTVGIDETDSKDETKDSRENAEPVEETSNKGSPKPTHLDFVKSKQGTPLTPTGYPQPPTPDFPPPSPATAMLGIEMKIQQIKQEYYHQMDSKRKSRDITTLTDDTLGCIQEQRSEVKDTEESSKVTEATSEVKVPETISEVKVTAEVKAEVNETVKDSEVKEKEVSSELETNTNEISDSHVTQSVDTQTELFEQKSGDKTDKSVKLDSVINSETKNIPKSSIPQSVIETEAEDMSKNKPPIAKKPERKPVIDKASDNEKVKDQDDSAKSGTGDGGESPVVMRRKTSTPDMDMFKGLLRGSTVGLPGKQRSRFYNEVLRHSQAKNQELLPLKSKMEKADEDIDIDQVMESIDEEVAKRASATDPSSFDDSEEWEKIADIMSSFGGNLTTFASPTQSPCEEEFNVAFEAYMDSLLTRRERGSGQMISIGEWLESIDMGQYENAFVANGYDNIDYLDSNILEEQDLEQIGVLSHEHRQKILQATKSLPLLKPIDPNEPPPSVEEWLMTLQLPDYLETFTTHGYDTIEKVQSILWELQLRTVLDISTLGHRKRILASLGERKPIDRHTPTQKKRSLSSLSPEDRSPFNNIDLFKDYTNVKPVSSSEEDIKESSQMAVDSSEDDDVFKKKTTGQSIRNSNIHVRPPHMAQTSSPAKQWRHKPEMLIKGCCNYTAQYLGSTVVPELTAGTESTRAGITKLKLRFLHQLQKSADILAKIPVIMLSISYKGVKFIDAKSKKVICDHEIGNIFCACQDTDNLNFFAYITRDIETGQHYCHVFSVKSSSLAHDIILTLGESFEVAYQMALKEKSNEEAMELDRKMSQSDVEDTYSTVSKISTNTV